MKTDQTHSDAFVEGEDGLVFSIYYVEVQNFLLIAVPDRYACLACDLVALACV